MFKQIILALVVVSSLASCGEKGNGNLVTEDRPETAFHSVISSGEFDVILTKDSVHSVKVEAESNIIDRVQTRVNGANQLEISIKRHKIRNTLPLKVYVSIPELRKIEITGSGYARSGDTFGTGSGKFEAEVSGSGKVDLATTCDNAFIKVTGSGDLTLEGTCVNEDIRVSGSGDVDAFGLQAQTCKARVTGSGNIRVSVSERLDADVSGSGDITYMGDPEVNTNISGSGKVRKL